MKLLSSSRLNLQDLISIDKRTFFHAENWKPIPRSDEDIFYVWKDNDRLDKLAYKYYESPLYTWAIAKANDILIERDIESGTVLRIPSMITIIRYLGEK